MYDLVNVQIAFEFRKRTAYLQHGIAMGTISKPIHVWVLSRDPGLSISPTRSTMQIVGRTVQGR